MITEIVEGIFQPAHNNYYLVFDSTNKNELGFRYVVTITVGGVDIVVYRVKPRPNDGFGVVDVSKVLQTQLGIDFTPSELAGFEYVNQYLEFTYSVDEEYFIQEDFEDYLFAGSVGSWPNFNDPIFNPDGGAKTKLEYTSEPVFEIGDTIQVTQDDTVNFRPELEGVHSVLDKYEDTGTWYLVLDLPWIGSGAASAGVTSYSDGRKSVFTGISSDSSCWNGALNNKDFNTYEPILYAGTNAASKLATTYINGVRLSRNKPSWFFGFNANEVDVYAVFELPSGTKFRYLIGDFISYLFNVIPSDDNVTQVNTGTGYVPYASGQDWTTVKEYTARVETVAGDALSIDYDIELYSECDYHDTFDICFMDRLGSWITIPFNKGSYLDQSVTRSEYRKKYGDVVVDKWRANNLDRGLTTYHSDENLTYKVNTGQLTEDESFYFRELFSSRHVYVSINSDDFESINLVGSNYNLPKSRTQRQRIAEVSFVKSIQDNING